MCLIKMTVPNLTQKSSGLLKDWWSICILFLQLFQFNGRPQASIVAFFRRSADYVDEVLMEVGHDFALEKLLRFELCKTDSTKSFSSQNKEIF